MLEYNIVLFHFPPLRTPEIQVKVQGRHARHSAKQGEMTWFLKPHLQLHIN